MLFFFAGIETTAVTLTNVMYMLHLNPQVCSKLRSEMVELRASNPSPSMEKLLTMPYLNAIYKETLRLLPALPRSFRDLEADTVLPSGLKLPRGTSICVLTWSMHRDPKVWGPDAKEFRPERWLQTKSAEQEKLINKAYIPFGYGKRNCIGRNLGLMEVLICLFVLYSTSELKYSLAPGFEPKLGAMMTLSWHHGMQFIVTKS